jgi:hypothetical protein
MTDPKDKEAEYAARVQRDVKEFGCHIAVLTDDDGAPMCLFTVGLMTTYHHPEVVVFGLELDIAEDLLDVVQEQIEAGERFEPGKKYDKLLRTYACTFRPVAARHVPMFTTAVAFHGRSDFPMLQLFWPDKQGRYPWEPGVREGHRAGQPVLEGDDPWS